VRAKAYDFVCNGVEVGGGSLRIHDGKLQAKMFDILGLPPSVPWHSLASSSMRSSMVHRLTLDWTFGFDRFVSIMAGLDTIRDCIAFPKNNSGRDVMLDAPSPIDQSQLDELYIDIDHKRIAADNKG